MNSMLTNTIIAERLRQYIEQEGISKHYIADMLDKSVSSIHYLLSEQNQTITTFSMQLADILGLSSTYFLKNEFISSNTETFGSISFSNEELSLEGVKDVENLIQLCNILALYSEEFQWQNGLQSI